MKKLLLVLPVVAIVSTGCMNTAAVVKAMGESNASVSVDIRTIYGTARVVRLNPGATTPPHAIGQDGTVAVGTTP